MVSILKGIGQKIRDSPWLDEVLLAIHNGGYRGREDSDIVQALDKSPKYFELDKYKL